MKGVDFLMNKPVLSIKKRKIDITAETMVEN
jgi:hypothetical protein